MKVVLFTVLALVMLYLFLVAPRMFGKPDRSFLNGVHYAHRGLFDNESDAPENSLRAIKKAVENGYGIEFDVQLSKDQIPVVFHDLSLERMCGIKGNVCDYTLEELQTFQLANSNETIPTLEQVLEVVAGKVPLIIEYKMDLVNTKVCEISNQLLEKYDGMYCIESFHPWAVKWYKEHRPEIVRGQLSQDYSKDGKYHGAQYWAMKQLLTNFLTRPDFIAYRHSDADVFVRQVCKMLGALSVAWTIRSQEEYETAKSKYDLFIFDSFILANDK